MNIEFRFPAGILSKESRKAFLFAGGFNTLLLCGGVRH